MHYNILYGFLFKEKCILEFFFNEDFDSSFKIDW